MGVKIDFPFFVVSYDSWMFSERNLKQNEKLKKTAAMETFQRDFMSVILRR